MKGFEFKGEILPNPRLPGPHATAPPTAENTDERAAVKENTNFANYANEDDLFVAASCCAVRCEQHYSVAHCDCFTSTTV